MAKGFDRHRVRQNIASLLVVSAFSGHKLQVYPFNAV